MRISCTQLESFRLFMSPDQEWMSEADLAATIRGEFQPTPQVERGKAFGLVLEQPERYAVSGGYICNGYQFGADVMAPCLALMDRRGVFEAKATKDYLGHTVVAMADQLSGARLIEHKTTSSTFDFDKYAASCQWRFMADIFQPSMVTYHVFCLDDSPTQVIGVRSIETFNLFPYAELHADCEDLVRRFVDYVVASGLSGVLEERAMAAMRAA